MAHIGLTKGPARPQTEARRPASRFTDPPHPQAAKPAMATEATAPPEGAESAEAQQERAQDDQALGQRAKRGALWTSAGFITAQALRLGGNLITALNLHTHWFI